MSRQKHTVEEIINKLREVRGLAGEGDVDRGSDAAAWNKRCNVLSQRDGFATSGGGSMEGYGLIRQSD